MFKIKTSRRQFLGGFAALPSFNLFSPRALAGRPEDRLVHDYYAELGVEPFINAVGPYSSLGGAKMWPEVIDAMAYAIENKARMTDIHDAVGKRIAELLTAEAAMVTSGATGALMLATAACMTMGDLEKNERLPDTTDMANEVIILKSQRYLYDRSIRAPGAKLVEIESISQATDAINDKTAMLFFLLNRSDETGIDVQGYIRIAKQYGIPILCDAATTVPPVKKIAETVRAGFDLICYSGGKGLRGPYSAGLLLGRKDLIGYARQHASPNHRAYGRSMKVAPEEYLGMMVAVETSLNFDEEKEYQRQLDLVDYMGRELSGLNGVSVSTHVPAEEAREPYIEVNWDERYAISPGGVKQLLRDGKPCIEIRALFLSGGRLHLTASMLEESQAPVIVKRIKEILDANAKNRLGRLEST
ncbi:MAG: aminotransferase class V-fold PLP-dependent enzyme [Gammaproteobacteria bacterium]|nr:aminotransferase class V-fold PLP-dependent enzyme [Gammaproteobacteria bacterium]MBT5203528.1 aminotransferase class V-fold PLP-dependent enzyme [Gammaproteobacteria bacterium]